MFDNSLRLKGGEGGGDVRCTIIDLLWSYGIVRVYVRVCAWLCCGVVYYVMLVWNQMEMDAVGRM